MVFQRIMKQRRRGRSWLCRSVVVDTDDVAVDACTRTSTTKGISTMSKTLNKKHSTAYGSSSNNTTTTGGGSNSSSSTGIEMRNGEESDSGNDSSRDQIVMDTTTTPHPYNLNNPAWKAENFVSAPLVEDDWWEDVDDDIDDNDDDIDDTSSYNTSICGKHGTYSDDDDDDEESRQQQLRSTIPIWNSLTNSSEASQPIHMLSGSYTSSSSTTDRRSKDGKRQFCNRGLQIWHQTRRIWKMELHQQRQQQNKTKVSPTSFKKQQILIPESFRKELVQCLADRRQFELSQSIPLSCVINAYEEVWREHGCD